MSRFSIQDSLVVLKGPRMSLTLDASEIYLNDPGQGTPCLVDFDNGDGGTFTCVSETGEAFDGYQLDDEQKEWLSVFSEDVARWLIYQTELAKELVDK